MKNSEDRAAYLAALLIFNFLFTGLFSVLLTALIGYVVEFPFTFDNWMITWASIICLRFLIRY